MIPIGDNNPTRRFPVVNWILIVLNIVIFVVEMQQGNDFIIRWSFIPARLTAMVRGEEEVFVLVTILSAMFLHAGIGHIFGNLLFLWIFGDNVEDAFGHLPYLFFYLFCGIGATLIQYWTDPLSRIPNLGASGAISGVLAAYMILYPRAMVRLAIWPIVLLIGTIPVPALLLIGVWFLMQLASGFQTLGAMMDQGGVAYWAHIGGFVIGAVLVWFLRPRRPRSPGYA